MTDKLSIRPLTPRLGAEISGIDINNMDHTQFDQLRRVWQQYKVIFIRDQQLELDQLLRFSSRFGKLMQLPYIKPHQGYPDIIRVLKQADEINMGTFGGDWHSDFSFLEAPPMASILYAEQVPSVGGDTLWIDMVEALKQLPDELFEKLEGRNAIHTGAPYGVQNAPVDDTQFKGSVEIVRNNPEADQQTLHPAICRHPETNEAMLFVNPIYTTGIEGFPQQQAQRLLDRVYSHCTRPEFGCRFSWRAGSVAIWDNRNTLHYAVNDYDGHRRCLYRTTITGHKPEAA